MAEKEKEKARRSAKRSEKAEEDNVKLYYLLSAERALFIQFFL